jgi:hypothetical protein
MKETENTFIFYSSHFFRLILFPKLNCREIIFHLVRPNTKGDDSRPGVSQRGVV